MDSSIQNPELGEMTILDDLLILRGADEEQTPLLAYPKTGMETTDFDLFTARDLDTFVDHAAKYYLSHGYSPVDENDQKIAALFGPSDLDYIISIFALSRLGYAVLLISPRLAPQAVTALLQGTKCNTVVFSQAQQLMNVLGEVQKVQISATPMVQRRDYDKPVSDADRFFRVVDKKIESTKVAIICHSSGSTGLPKPIYQTHRRVSAPYPRGAGSRDICTLPWYHSMGKTFCINSMFRRKTVYLHSASIPMTSESLMQLLASVRPGVLLAVPYALKLLGENEQGIEALKMCEDVVFTGSQCPDQLGDLLVQRGVNLGTIFGGTEFGMFGTSMNRTPGDKSWDYLRPAPSIRPYLKMKSLGDDTFEAVFLKGLPSLSETNSDDPPGSFHSRDIFAPHPTIPDRWKHLGRIDDRITLVNGEKVLPLPIEGRIRQEELVAEAIMFGIEKSIPGIIVIRSERAKNLSDEAFVNAIWPAIEDANLRAESFSQVSREMIVSLPAGTQCPATDKGSIIRAQVYRKFADAIEKVYSTDEGSIGGGLEMDIPETEMYLMRMLVDGMGFKLPNAGTDFFGAGMDSLQALQARSRVQREISLGENGAQLSQNIFFETGNVAKLARKLFDIRTGAKTSQTNVSILQVMERSLAENSAFEKLVQGRAGNTPEKPSVVLTGATGSLGAHILTQLLSRHDFQHVYCLIRGSTPTQRMQRSLFTRGLGTFAKDPRIVALTCNLSEPDLGLDPARLNEIRRQTTLIIDSAWTVNFNLGFEAFSESIRGVHNLIQLSLSVTTQNPARFMFCSSIATALGTPGPANIPENILRLEQCSPGGYGRSKAVAEHIIQRAWTNFEADAHILRIGQIVGDTKLGIWNDSEAIPLMIRSALTLKALPELGMECSWLPVDTVARIICDLSFLDQSPQQVYNIRSPHTFDWSCQLLPALREAGLPFETVSTATWLSKLKESAKRADEEAVEQNPAIKLIDYYERAYEDTTAAREIKFEIDGATKDSESLREAPQLIEDEIVSKFVDAWMPSWTECKKETKQNGQ